MDDKSIKYSIGRELLLFLRETTKLTEMDVMGTIADLGNAQIDAARQKFDADPNKRDFHSRRKIKFPGLSLNLLFKMKAYRSGATCKISVYGSNAVTLNRHEILQKVMETNLLGAPDERIL